MVFEMTPWIFFMSTLAVIYCRPQINVQETSPIEIEKVSVVEITPKYEQQFENLKSGGFTTQKELDEKTKEILAKIALVNEKQGLTKKKPYQYLSFGYLRSQDDHANRQRVDTDFKFPRDPFTNPILDYIEKKNSYNVESNKRTPTINFVNQEPHQQNDEVPAGHYIKRKIVHQQTMLVPSMAFNPGNMPPLSPNIPQYYYGMNRISPPMDSGMKQSELEMQTINNIKNIVGNSQYVSPVAYNSYLQPFNSYPYQPTQGDDYRLYGPYASQYVYRPAKQTWQWPWGQYFPITIRDPFIHMMNAMTTMVEFGQQGSSMNACSKEATETKISHEALMEKNADENKLEQEARKMSEDAKLSYIIVNGDKGPELTVSNDDDSNSTTTLDIEDLRITSNEKEPVQMNLRFRQAKHSQEIKKSVVYNSSTTSTDLLNNPIIQTLYITKTLENTSDSSRQSPPIRDQILHDDELEDEFEKAEEVQVSHDGNKKLFSKDNTGSGIFVHKIKVRKGGVAIAGPGGIATAGSGGTAIVGPNGFAYTHPDSLAIAGSGTKVVAVEPTINLSQIIMDHDKNKTRGNGHVPPRVGKIVAVGPVIYYNKG